MPLYERVFTARQDISAGQVDTLADEMEKLISDNGGSVARREYWGLRNLAYRVFVRFRYRIFGRLDACRVPSPEERELFLD